MSKRGRQSRGAPRRARVNRQIQTTLAELISTVKDPWVQETSVVGVSEVRVNADLSQARVFVSVMGDDAARQAVLDGLARARGFLRSELAQRMRMRSVPDLRFEIDTAQMQAAHIEEVLQEIARGRRREAPLEEIAQVLRGAQRILVTSHPSPDGDAIGSIVAAQLALTAEDKRVVAFNPDPVPHTFEFLAGADRIVRELPDGPFDVTLVLDCAEARMFGDGPPPPEITGTVVVIDHHKTDGDFGQLVHRDPAAAAVGVLLHRLFRVMEIEISQPVAESLYTSILSDTGSFRYQNTDPEALRVAADLVARGVDPWKVASNLYETRPREQLELLAVVLNTLRVSEDGRAAALTVTKRMLAETGSTEDMVDGFVNFARGLRGVEVALLLRPGEGAVRVSMRSRGAIDVSEIAERFAGGGHRNAAGFTAVGVEPDALLEALFAEVSSRASAEPGA